MIQAQQAWKIPSEGGVCPQTLYHALSLEQTFVPPRLSLPPKFGMSKWALPRDPAKWILKTGFLRRDAIPRNILEPDP